MTDPTDAMFNRLSEALDLVDPIPDDAVAAAKEAFLTRDLDARFAALVMDSAAEFEALAMRGDILRSLSFELDGRSIELEIDRDGATVVGQLAPPLPAEVVLELDGGEVASTTTDEFGRFHFGAPALHDVSVVVRIRAAGSEMICAFDL